MKNQHDPNGSHENHDKPEPFNVEKAKLIVESIINHPAAINYPYLVMKAQQFQRKSSRIVFNKIVKFAMRLNLLGYDPNSIRPIVKQDPVTLGEILLGIDGETEEHCTLNRFDIVRHLAILAGTGGGKSTLLRNLAWQLHYAGINVTIFQKRRNQFENLHDEYGPIFTTFFVDELRLSLFETIDHEHLQRWFHTAVAPIHEIYSLQNSIGFLLEATNILASQWPSGRIQKNGFPTIRDLQDALNQVPGVKPHQKKYIDSAESILRRIWAQNEIFHARKGMYESLRNLPSVINYGDGQVKTIKLIVTHLADRFIIDNQNLPEEEKKFWVLILDDAQEFMEKHSGDRIDSVANKLNLTRENRLGFVLAFHNLHDIDPKYLTSIENKITGYTKDYNMALSMTRLLGIRPENANTIAMFQPGQFVLSSTSSQGSVKFQGFLFDHPDIVDREIWEQKNNENKKQFTYIPYVYHTEKEKSEKTKHSFSENSNRILHETSNHPFLNSSELKIRLGINNNAFKKAINELVSLKAINKRSIGPWTAYELTRESWDKVGLKPPVHKGGFSHAFAVHRIEAFLSQQGYESKREFALAPSSHPVDLCAWKNEKILTVEFETGNSDYIHNLIECSKTQADQIYCVTIDENIRKKIYSKLRSNIPLNNEMQSGRLRVAALWNFINPKQK